MDPNDPRKRLQALQQSNPSIRAQAQPQTIKFKGKDVKVNYADPIEFRTREQSAAIDAQQPQKKTFRGLEAGPEKNKTIFGKNAAWLLPKSLEKTRTVRAGGDINDTEDNFLKRFDGTNEEARRFYIKDLQAEAERENARATASGQLDFDPVASRTLKLLQDKGRFEGNAKDFITGNADKVRGGLARGLFRGVDFVLPGKNTFGLENLANQLEDAPQYTKKGKLGEQIGSVEKGIIDLKMIAKGAGGAEKAASKIPGLGGLIENLSNGGKWAKTAADIIKTTVGSFAGTGISSVQTAGKGDEQNLGKDAAIGLGMDLVLGGSGKLYNKFKGGKALKQLIETTDETSIIKQIMKASPDADEAAVKDAAKLIAGEKDPAVIKAALESVDAPKIDVPKVDAPTGAVAPDTTIHLPGQGVYAKVTPEQAAFLKNEVANVSSTADDIVHLSAPTKALEKNAKEVTLDEIMARSPNAKKSLESVPKPTQAVEEAVPVSPTGKVEQAIEELPASSGVNVDAQATPDLGTTVAQNADNATKTVQTADDIVPDADVETKKAIQEVLDSLNGAQTSYDDVAKIRSKEKGARIGAGQGAFEAAGGGEAGFQAKLGSLKGQYSKSGFNAIQATPEAQNAIINAIEGSADLKPFQKLNTQNAVRKIWGTVDAKPTPSDIKYIRDFFGDDMADAVEQAVKDSPTTWRERVAQIASTPKAAMATGDLSAPLRQGGVLGTRFPKQFAKVAKEQVKFFASEKAYQEAMQEITTRPTYELMQKAKLAVDGATGVTGTEEAFLSSLLESKIVKKLQYGKLVAASDRGYTGFLTKFRADVFDKIVSDSAKAGVELDDAAIASLGKFINSASGRGDLGSLERHAGLLSKALFSPRLWKSRLDLLNPKYYYDLKGPARKVALQSSASFAATAGTILSLAAMAGATVVWDPRSADFAKIKVGNTRYDILGGLQQNIRLGAQLISGEKIDSTTGELQTLGPDRGFGKPSRKDILMQFVENKENPLIAYATKLMEGSDFVGNPINPVTEAAKLAVPLNVMGIAETTKDTGNFLKSVAMNVPGTFGVGVQTYGNKKTKDTGKNGEYVGKVTEDMVTDKNGKVILDDKGKPVKATFPEGASKLEKEALIDDKRNAALADQYRKTLPGEDQALLKLSDNQLSEYVKNGKITPQKYKELQSTQQVIKNISGIKVPKGVRSKGATDFYKTYNGLNKDEQEQYLDAPADEPAKVITKELNTKLPKGLRQLEPSNKVALAFAEHEKDLNTHEYSDIELQNKNKSFFSKVYKENHPKHIQDIYKEGGSDDLKYFMENNAVTKDDLNAAIKLDNELYEAGLAGLKFSKKFRNQYGYATPDKDGGDGSGSGAKTQRAQLMALMPSFKKGAKLPEFSAVARTKTAKKTSIPKSGGNAKKISIKL